MHWVGSYPEVLTSPVCALGRSSVCLLDWGIWDGISDLPRDLSACWTRVSGAASLTCWGISQPFQAMKVLLLKLSMKSSITL